jgi:DNA-binding XRE family transcriptional regulator
MSARRRTELISARKAVGYTQESLAEALHVDRSTVVRWEAGDYAPLPFLWPKLAKLLARSNDQLRLMLGTAADHEPVGLGKGLDPAFDWLDRHAGWVPGTSHGRVAIEASVRRWSGPEVGRSHATEALAGYYGDSVPGFVRYGAALGQIGIETSIITRPGWLDLACPLTAAGDQITLTRAGLPTPGLLDEGAAIRRLAEAAADEARIADVPIYRLLDVDAARGVVAGTVSTAPFVEYALSVDLLERELSSSLATGKAFRRGTAPLRDRYLPDMAAVVDLPSRFCSGGVLALTAIARPADPYRGSADYLLLIQERSGRVVNAAGRLAVIPKAFHRPHVDFRADARIGATLRREMEEELFGRSDVDNTIGEQRAADPMHPSRLSAPMRWLTEEPDRLRMECTGLGFNLVSGNYEFASLIVIDDEAFWSRFGGEVEANWESAGLRQYSTLDGESIAELVVDESWSNEGLFALLQGLRRLGEIGKTRVDMPAIELNLTC